MQDGVQAPRGTPEARVCEEENERVLQRAVCAEANALEYATENEVLRVEMEGIRDEVSVSQDLRLKMEQELMLLNEEKEDMAARVISTEISQSTVPDTAVVVAPLITSNTAEIVVEAVEDLMAELNLHSNSNNIDYDDGDGEEEERGEGEHLRHGIVMAAAAAPITLHEGEVQGLRDRIHELEGNQIAQNSRSRRDESKAALRRMKEQEQQLERAALETTAVRAELSEISTQYNEILHVNEQLQTAAAAAEKEYQNEAQALIATVEAHRARQQKKIDSLTAKLTEARQKLKISSSRIKSLQTEILGEREKFYGEIAQLRTRLLEKTVPFTLADIMSESGSSDELVVEEDSSDFSVISEQNDI